MSTQLLFYTDVSPVTMDKHKNISVKNGTDYDFAKSVNSVPITAVEFRHLANEYVIVFVAGKDDSVVPVVLLGLKKDENLFVDDKAQWDAQYIPAFIRRYPFIFALSEDKSTFTLCIDDKYKGCNTEGKGERLFDSEGERTGYLEQVVNFQTEYQKQQTVTLAFAQKLKELDLLEEINVTVKNQESNYKLNGMLTVNREKFKAIKDETLSELFKSDVLELIYLHLQSLNNLNDIARKITPDEVSSDTQKKAEEQLDSDVAMPSSAEQGKASLTPEPTDI